MNADDLMVALKRRYAAPAWCLLPQVRNGTGFTRSPRTADALAMSLWPSRGLELHGFEIKVSRADLRREIADPRKAEEIAQFCDRWWLVLAERELADLELLPSTWGVLIPRGGKLVALREAEKMDPTPINRLFLAAVLRKAYDVVVPKAEIEAELKAAREAGRKDQEWSQNNHTDMLRRNHEQLQASVQEFEKASGVQIGTYDGGRIGAAVKTVLDRGRDRILEDCREQRERLRKVSSYLDAAIEVLQLSATDGAHAPR
jgi:hypothetical protein